MNEPTLPVGATAPSDPDDSFWIASWLYAILMFDWRHAA